MYYFIGIVVLSAVALGIVKVKEIKENSRKLIKSEPILINGRKVFYKDEPYIFLVRHFDKAIIKNPSDKEFHVNYKDVKTTLKTND